MEKKRTMWCNICVGDARKALNQIPENYVDLIVTSPPYFALKKYSKNPQEISTGSIEAYLNDLKDVFEKCFLVLKDGAFFCIVIGQYTSKEKSYFIPGSVAKLLQDTGFEYRREHIWVKPKGTQGIWNRGTTQFLKKPFPRNTMINIHHEHILIFQKGNNVKIREDEKLSEKEVKEYAWSVWEIPVSMTKNHPAPFPDEVAKRLIKMYSYQGEVVADPFLGTGTTCKAALELKRNCIGIEVNPNYLPLIQNVIGFDQLRLHTPIKFDVVRCDKEERLLVPSEELPQYGEL
jgi:DNA modification methylase